MTYRKLPGLSALFNKPRIPPETTPSNSSGVEKSQLARAPAKPDRMDCGGYNEAFILQHWSKLEPWR